MVTEDAYEKGRAYNDVIMAQEKQEKLGWTSDIFVDNNMVKFKLADKDGEAIAGAKIIALISRPMQADLEQKIKTHLCLT